MRGRAMTDSVSQRSAKSRGGDAAGAAEDPRQVLLTRESTIERDVGDSCVGCPRQTFGSVDSEAHEKLVRRDADGCTKLACEMAGTEARSSRDLREVDRLLEVRLHVIDCLAQI